MTDQDEQETDDRTDDIYVNLQIAWVEIQNTQCAGRATTSPTADKLLRGKVGGKLLFLVLSFRVASFLLPGLSTAACPKSSGASVVFAYHEV